MKIKLRDLTEEQYEEWSEKKCNGYCHKCIFNNVRCKSYNGGCWVFHKDLYSDNFLNQEVEIEDEGGILTEEERKYLSNVIKPFRDSVMWIMKHDSLFSDVQFIQIMLNNNYISLPYFEPYKYYKNMEADKEYTLEELGL